MFGYIGCVKEKLSEEEQKRYQSIYCGLCRNLKERYGQVERLCLSYDMAFLILLLSSLYEPEEKSGDSAAVSILSAGRRRLGTGLQTTRQI